MHKGISVWGKDTLKNDLKNIPHIWRVSHDVKDIIHLLHKEFSLMANYPKGHKRLFREFFLEKHAGEYLFQIKHTAGLRQDIVTMGSLALYWNRNVYLEFLVDRMKWYSNGKRYPTTVCLDGTHIVGSSCISKTFFYYLFVINCTCVLVCCQNTQAVSFYCKGTSMGRS